MVSQPLLAAALFVSQTLDGPLSYPWNHDSQLSTAVTANLKEGRGGLNGTVFEWDTKFSNTNIS